MCSLSDDNNPHQKGSLALAYPANWCRNNFGSMLALYWPG